MTIAVRPRRAIFQRRLHVRLVVVVEVTRRLVEDHHLGVLEEQASDRQALLLAARQPVAALAHDGVVAVGKSGDGVVDARRLGGGDDLVGGRLRLGVAQVVADRHVEEVRVLADHSDGAVQRCQREVADVVAVDADRSRCDVVEARDQRHHRRLAGTRGADEGDRLAGGDVERDAVEDVAVGVGVGSALLQRGHRCLRRRRVAEAHGIERHPAPVAGDTARTANRVGAFGRDRAREVDRPRPAR